MLYENSWYWSWYGYYSETPPYGRLVLQSLFWFPASRGLSRRGNRRLHRRERPLLTGNFFGRLAKRPYIFLKKKALVNTVEPRLTATSVILSPVNTANFFWLIGDCINGVPLYYLGEGK